MWPGGTFLRAWSQSWSENQSKILTLAFINLTITFLSEFVVRHAMSEFLNADLALLVSESGLSVQGVINCLYTFIISLLGVPLLFFKNIKTRYIFFLLFGVSISYLSQLIGHKMTTGHFNVDFKRLLFDFSYIGTLKFLSFELFRPALILKEEVRSLFYIRVSQDFLQTIIKTLALMLVGLNN